MDAEHPTSPRHLLGRFTATLLALLLLYPLSAGPAMYVAERFPGSQPLIALLYVPLLEAIERTPLAGPFYSYAMWWQNLARYYGHSE